MTIRASVQVTEKVASHEAGLELGHVTRSGCGEGGTQVVLVFATVNHALPALLRGVREAHGPAVRVLGCSVQGVMARRFISERGYVAGALGLGGEGLEVATACVEQIDSSTFERGVELGTQLMRGLRVPPKVVVVHYDPLCGANIDLLLEGLHRVVPAPIVGGGAGHYHGPMGRTFQFYGEAVMQRSAVAFALGGAVGVETAVCHGTTPVGVEMTVSRAEGNRVYELDGRPALEVWEEVTGAGPPHIDHTAALAIAVPPPEGSGEDGLVRAAFGVEPGTQAVILQAGLVTGTRVMLHHRTVEGVRDGSRQMAQRLLAQLGGRAPRAVLGFECGARGEQFLGHAASLAENVELQESLGPEAAWLGMLAWGELYPVAGRPAFHNYTYPLLVLVDG